MDKSESEEEEEEEEAAGEGCRGGRRAPRRGQRRGGAEALELLDERGDDGLGTEHLLLLAVEHLASSERLLRLQDAVVLLPQRAEALRHHAEHRPVGGLGRRGGRGGGCVGGGVGGGGGGVHGGWLGF